MADTFGDILPLAIGIAISPIPIIAVILMLFSNRARTNGPSFLVGWVFGISLVTIVVLLVADAGDAATDSGTSDGVSTGKLVLGVILIALGLRQWRGRPQPGEPAAMPKWMASIDAFTPVKAMGFGVVLSAVNPKNLILAAGAGATIAQAGLSSGDDTVVVILFILVSSASIAGAVVAYLFGGEKVQQMLDGWKAWLGVHNAAVLTVLFVVMGAVLVGKGLDVFD